jgi:hypothetical protein
VIQSVITAPTPTPTPTNFLEPFETYFRSQQKTKSSSSVNLRPAAPSTKARSIEHRGGALTKDRNYFEEFKIQSDFGNNFPEFSETPQSVKETGNSQTGRIPQKNEYYSYSFRYLNDSLLVIYCISIGGQSSSLNEVTLIIIHLQYTSRERLWR